MLESAEKIVAFSFKPDRTSQVAVVGQIVRYISQKIAIGEWLVGQCLPPQRKMAEIMGINRSTVAEAMAVLGAQGLIEGRTGQGTRIINNSWSLVMSDPPPNWHSYMDSGIHKSEAPTLQALRRLEAMEGVIRLSTDDMAPELFPREMVEEALRHLPKMTSQLGHGDALGSERLRKILASSLAKQGIEVSPTSILVTNNSWQALQLISVGMLAPGSVVRVDTPSYLKGLAVFQAAGMKLQAIPMDQQGMLPWMIPNDKTTATSLVYTMPTFQNPTGIVMGVQRRQELIGWCRSKGIPIIEDDTHRELWLDDPPPTPLKAMDKGGNVLYLGGTLRPLAPAIQLGWVVGPEPVIARLGEIRQQTDSASTILMQHALAELIMSGEYDRFSMRLRAQLRKRRDFTLMVLEEYFKDLAIWDVPAGGPYIWLRFKRRISAERLFAVALEEHLVIHPGEMYDFGTSHALRLSYAYASLADLDKGLQRLSHLVRRMSRK